MVIDQPLKKEDRAYSTVTSINQIILWMTWEWKSLRKFTTVLTIQPSSLHFAGQGNCSGSRSSVQPNHMASMTKSKGSVPWAASHARRQTSTVSLNKQPRRKRSHGKMLYNKRALQPDVTMSTLIDLVDMIDWIVSISFPQLRSLQALAMESNNFDYSSAEYRVTVIILYIANYKLLRPVRSDVPAENPKNFMKIKFLNKAVDAINLSVLLRSTSSLTKFQSTLETKSHQLCHMNTLALLPANYLTLHQPFQILMFVNISLIRKLTSVRNASFAINHMAMLSLEI